jgi:hypothetical protein
MTMGDFSKKLIFTEDEVWDYATYDQEDLRNGCNELWVWYILKSTSTW